MLRRLLKPDRAVSEITGGDVVELGVLQSERHIYCMTQRTSTERETKAMQFLCFTKALLKIIIPTHCNNLNELNDRKIFFKLLSSSSAQSHPPTVTDVGVSVQIIPDFMLIQSCLFRASPLLFTKT